MKDEKEYTLINGTFSALEAWEIIRNLYTSKIRFHEMRNFSMKERFGKDDSATIKRISELKESLHAVSDLLNQGGSGKLNYEIISKVSITVLEEKN